MRFAVDCAEQHDRVTSGAIIGDGDRKQGAHTFSPPAVSLGIRHPDIVYPRGSTHMSGALLLDQMVRVAIFSCRFFTAMAGNKTGNKNQGPYM